MILSHYSNRFCDIFRYTSKNPFYIILKTLCIIVGLPLYCVLIPVDLVCFLVYALLALIPLVGTFALFIFKGLSIIYGIGYYIAVLPDAKEYLRRSREETEEEEQEEDQEQTLTDDKPENETITEDKPED